MEMAFFRCKSSSDSDSLLLLKLSLLPGMLLLVVMVVLLYVSSEVYILDSDEVSTVQIAREVRITILV